MDYSGHISGLLAVTSVLFAFITYVERPLLDDTKKAYKRLSEIDLSFLSDKDIAFTNQIRTEWERLINQENNRNILNASLFLFIIFLFISLYFINITDYLNDDMLLKLMICGNVITFLFFSYSIVALVRVVRKHKQFLIDVNIFETLCSAVKSATSVGER